MNVLPPFRRLQVLYILLPFFALGCNGSSPTEPAEQPKAVAAAVTAQEQAAPAAPSGEAPSEGSLPAAAARLRALRAGAEPGEQPSEMASVADEARGGKPGKPSGRGGGNGNGNGGGNGNGNGGNGNGNGNGGNGGGGGGNRRGELRLEIHPDVWNFNWTHAEGNVQAFVRGEDATDIDTATVELVAPGGGTLAPRSVRIAGGQLVATFSKAEAFDLLGDDVETGDRITLTLRFDVVTDAGAEAKELTDEIRIVGRDPDDDDDGDDDEEGELALNIQPDDWNTNWARSSGQVHAFLRGPGLADVDLDSIRLVGDLVTASPLEPLDVRRVGHQIVARFSKRGAFNTLDDPDSGETHTVKIRFMQAGVLTELSEDILIVGP